MHTRPRAPGSVLVVVGVLSASGVSATLGGCSRAPSQSQGGAGLTGSGGTPSETLNRLLAAREQRAYRDIKSLIVPEHAEEVISYLMAVDDFLFANRELCDYVRNEVGLGLAQNIDQSYFAGMIDVFSPYVKILDEIIEGDMATVSFQVNDKLPVKRARLRRVGGVWLYEPGPGYTPQLPQAFLRMAHGLRQTLQEIKCGRLSPRALRDDPELLAREVQVRLQSGVDLLKRPAQRDGE